MGKEIAEALAALRAAQSQFLAPVPIREMVAVLDSVSARLEEWVQEHGKEWGEEIAGTVRPLLQGLKRDALMALLEEEFGDPEVLDGFRPRPTGGAVRALGPSVVAHFFAGNIPLLAWPSLAAALLVKSASFGKLSHGAPSWAHAFVEALRAVQPDLARCIVLKSWPGGDRERDEALCTGADMVLAYGSDEALAALRALTPVSTPFLGYGHRVSIGVLAEGSDPNEAAAGFARDVLLYDQAGCLSAAMIFIEGNATQVVHFGDLLATALGCLVQEWALPPRDREGAARVHLEREAALFAEGARVWGDPQMRWTVIYVPSALPHPSCGACVVHLHAFPNLSALPELLRPLRRHLQGAALAAPPERREEAAEWLAQCGVSRICPPGALQAPPFRWHHDGRRVLAHLVRWTDLEMEPCCPPS